MKEGGEREGGREGKKNTMLPPPHTRQTSADPKLCVVKKQRFVLDLFFVLFFQTFAEIPEVTHKQLMTHNH